MHATRSRTNTRADVVKALPIASRPLQVLFGVRKLLSELRDRHGGEVRVVGDEFVERLDRRVAAIHRSAEHRQRLAAGLEERDRDLQTDHGRFKAAPTKTSPS